MRLTAVLGLTVTAFAAVVTLVAGSVDEFQCACGYNVQKHVKRLRTLLDSGVNDLEVANVAAAYGPLAARMLLVAHGKPDAAPTASWLWLLNSYANTVLERVQTTDVENGQPLQVPKSSTDQDHGPVADGIGRVDDDLQEYVRVCSGHGVAHETADWTQQMFEKYVLENMTAIVADDGRSEEDFRPRWLYLNDVAAADGPDDLGGILARNVGVDWKTAASRLRQMYGLSVRKWMFGTAELVLYQKKFLSTVAASMMGYVLVHVNLCWDYWMFNMRDGGGGAKYDGSVDEYSRVWMSIGNLLESFRLYLDLQDSTKYFSTMLDIAANPALDNDGFKEATRAIETNIVDVGDGLFGVKAIETSPVVTTVVTGTGDSKENPLIGLIALVDNNISSAEKYLKTVQELLQNVDFKIIHNFMKSTHIWLT